MCFIKIKEISIYFIFIENCLSDRKKNKCNFCLILKIFKNFKNDILQ